MSSSLFIVILALVQAVAAVPTTRTSEHSLMNAESFGAAECMCIRYGHSCPGGWRNGYSPLGSVTKEDACNDAALDADKCCWNGHSCVDQAGKTLVDGKCPAKLGADAQDKLNFLQAVIGDSHASMDAATKLRIMGDFMKAD